MLLKNETMIMMLLLPIFPVPSPCTRSRLVSSSPRCDYTDEIPYEKILSSTAC